MSFQERKTGRKDMRASTRKKSQWQKDEEVKGDFYFFSFFFLFWMSLAEKKEEIEGSKKYFRRVWFNPSVS
jgi:hypothetical protein